MPYSDFSYQLKIPCCLLLSSMWVGVAAVAHCVSSLLTMPVLGSPGSEWVLWLAVFQACWQCLPLALQDVSSCCSLLISSLLTMTDLHSSGCGWLLWLAVSQACWQCLFLALQWVSGYCALPCFKLGDNACPWLSSLWVTVVACCVSSLLTMPDLGSPVGEWFLWLAVFQLCWQWLSLALQRVGGCCGLLCFKPTDNSCSWLFSLWVATVPCCVLSLLTMTVLHSSECEWLLCFAVS